MPELSEFEKQRQENIQRNKELLKKLNLDSISQSIADEIPKDKPKAKRRKPSPKVKQEVEPQRRSRRIAGVKTENTEEFKKAQEEAEERDRQKKELEKLRSTRLYGNFSLIDLVTDRSSGNLKFEDKVYPVKKEKESEIKEEEENAEEKEEINIEEDNEVLTLFRDLGDKMSAGDFYDLIRDSKLDYNDKVLETKRKEFDDLKIYEKVDPLDIKLSHHRITSINFHSNIKDRIITAGDTNGDIGIWAVDSTKKDEDGDEEATVSILKTHGKSIARILSPFETPSKFYTASYDGSVRQMDLNKLTSTEVVYLHEPNESDDYPLGVSDINFCTDNPNLLYMTTLSGNFYQHDIRTAFKSIDTKKFLRLSDKKIGSFTINPNKSHQIATASLDRTLKIWDLRNVSKSNASWSEFEDQLSAHPYGAYNSRLSVSCVDWNIENRLVCNGYDDNICVFNLDDYKPGVPPVVEWAKDYQPPFKNKEEGVVPNNIQPFTKIRHNCQTGRWISILKSKWQTAPKDGVQKFVIANMKRGIDIYDQKGQIIAHLTGPKVGVVPAVTAFHPTENWVVGGSASGKIYMFE
ncbi:DNA damage-binding protein CMR1 [[Candida] jaroonii]|uniref:DNA damage-binding protein CMR1 n=1 Tax=[Candida] jaroonii TaxID=467808 RepID=A0ACA9Y4L2_9ASCO|nr:DNA damage-binding protein CMR1 [[Candida] jaroonii]